MTSIVINTQCHALLGLIQYLNLDNQDIPLEREQQKTLLRDISMLLEDAIFDNFTLIEEYGDELLREMVLLTILEITTKIQPFGTYHELIAIVPYDIAGSLILILAKDDYRSS